MQEPEPTILWLDASRALQASLVGGKVASLSRFASSHRVPLGFCLVTHVQLDGLTQKRFSRMLLPSELQSSLIQAYEELSAKCATPDVPVAVRSSAREEDGRHLSFAGQYETLLNVRGADAVIEAVTKCLVSASSQRARHYRAQHTGLNESGRFSVLVQQMVHADVSAVVFSANPVTGTRDEIVINANWGLGESIVGGLVTPDAFYVDKRTKHIISRSIALKERMTIPASQGTDHVAVPEARRSEPSLLDVQAQEVACLAADLEAVMGYAVDVECAYQDGLLFLLQCRPITNIR